MSDSVDTGAIARKSHGATAIAMDSADLLTAVESGAVPAMPLLMQASRLARDLGALRIEQWIEWEMRGYEGADDLARQLLRYTKLWVDETKGTAITDPLPAIETRIESLRTNLRNLGITDGENAPFADKDAVFFDNAASDAVRQVAIEMRQITAQLNRLVIVHANAMAMLHAFSDNAFAQHKHLLPEGFTVARAPVTGVGDEDAAALPIWESTSASVQNDDMEDDGLSGVPITNRDADGFDNVLDSETAGGAEVEAESSVATLEKPETDTESLLKELQIDSDSALDVSDDPAEQLEAVAATDVDTDSALDQDEIDGVSDEDDPVSDQFDDSTAGATDQSALDALLDGHDGLDLGDVNDGEHGAIDSSDVTADEKGVTVDRGENPNSPMLEEDDITADEAPSEEAGDEYESMMSELAAMLEDSIAEADDDVTTDLDSSEEAIDSSEEENNADSDSDVGDDPQLRDSVLDIMKATAPTIAGSIQSAEMALQRGTNGAAAQTVRTMRHALDAIADHVFPSRDESVTIENRKIPVGPDRPLNRLFAYAHGRGEQSQSARLARKSLLKLYWNLDIDMQPALDCDLARRLMNDTFRSIHHIMDPQPEA